VATTAVRRTLRRRKGRVVSHSARPDRGTGDRLDVTLADRFVDHVEPARLADVMPERAAGLVALVAHERGLVREGLGQRLVLRDRASRPQHPQRER
jgi:hypothetical protein